MKSLLLDEIKTAHSKQSFFTFTFLLFSSDLILLTSMFLNFKTTFSSNFFGLGSIAAIIILLPKYLCTKWFENEPECDKNMVV